MTQFRYCKFKDGAIKNFEDVCAGDVFQVFEPDGAILSSLDDENVTWFKAVSDYDGISGFDGMFIDDTKD